MNKLNYINGHKSMKYLLVNKLKQQLRNITFYLRFLIRESCLSSINIFFMDKVITPLLLESSSRVLFLCCFRVQKKKMLESWLLHVGLALAAFPVFLIMICLQTCSVQSNANHLCPPSCGNIHKISSPFRLKGDPENYGSNMHELVCENNQTVLYMFVDRCAFH